MDDELDIDRLQAFDDREWAALEARYAERLAEELEDARPFFFPFLRVLFWGRLGA